MKFRFLRALSAVSLSVASLAASAAWERVGSVEIAGTDRLAASITQFAGLTGNAMLGGLATGALMQSDAVQFFGPTRAGHDVLIPLYADGAKIAAKSAETLECTGFAVLYPVIATRQKFLKHHASAVETNGYIRIAKGYVKFSADGKWAAYGDREEHVDLALAEAGVKRRPMGGDLVRLSLDAKGMAVMRRAVEEAAGNPTNDISRQMLDAVRGLDSVSFSLRIGERGFDFGCSAVTVAGTELDRIGRKTLPADPLALADACAIAASVTASDFDRETSAAKYARVLSILKKHGLALPFLTCGEKPPVTAFVLDMAAFGRYCRSSATNAISKADFKKIGAEVSEAFSDRRPLKLSERLTCGTFSVKGAKPTFSPAERFAATLPEAAAKKPCAVGVTSTLALLRALAPELVKLADGEGKLTLKALQLMIPAEVRGGIATAAWREGGELKAAMRVSADEIKAVSVMAVALSAYASGRKSDDAGDGDDCGGDGDED